MEIKIHPNELRLGNLVKTIFNDEICKVIAIKKQPINNGFYYTIKVDKNEDYLLPEFIQPIPLTEDWLIKAEFIKNRTHPHLFRNIGKLCSLSIDYYPDNSIIELSCSGMDNEPNKIEHLKYLHQLQNLIHALSNEELTFNK